MFAGAAAFAFYRAFTFEKGNFRFPKFLLIPLATYLLGLALMLRTAPLANIESWLSQNVLFIVLTVWAVFAMRLSSSPLRTLDEWNLGSSAIVLLPTVFSLWHSQQRAVPFLGSPTMLGEFVGFSMVLQLHSLFFRTANLKFVSPLGKVLRLVWLSFCGLILYWIMARSALIGVALSISVFVGIVLWQRRKLPLRLVSITAVLLIVFAGAVYKISFSQDKVNTLNRRILRSKNTWAMIKDHPLGVGPDNFAGAYNEYQNAYVYDPEAREDSILGNPHNSFLELAAENGVICFLAFSAGLALLIFRLLQQIRTKEKFGFFPSLALGCLVYWTVDGLLNFPQDTPFPFWAMALTLAIALQNNLDFKVGKGDRVTLMATRGFFFIMAAIMIYLPAKQFYSEHLTYAGDASKEVLTKACQLDPQNWRACLAEVRLEWQGEEHSAALNTLDHIARRFPTQFAVRKATIELLWQSGEKEKSCQEMKKYDELFNHQSSVSDILRKYCGNL